MSEPLHEQIKKYLVHESVHEQTCCATQEMKQVDTYPAMNQGYNTLSHLQIQIPFSLRSKRL